MMKSVIDPTEDAGPEEEEFTERVLAPAVLTLRARTGPQADRCGASGVDVF